MKKKFVLIFFLFIASTFAQNADLNISTNLFWPAPNINKPAYLSQITEPDFGTKITRIVGNPGDSIPNITGKVWADSTLRHAYSKRQPWNSDMSMIFIENHYPNLWLDGETYQVLFTRSKPASRIRWSNTEPHIMYYVESDNTGLLGKWDVVEDTTSVLVDFSGYKSCSFGSGEGNFTNNGKKVAVLGTRKNDGHKVYFIVDVENKTKGADVDLSSYPKINNCTISPLGNYVIIGGDFGNGSDRIQVRNASSGTLLWEETGYGMPSHFDTQIDQEGNEVIAGVAKSDPYKGWVIKRNLASGDTTVVSVYPNTENTNNSWASHTSGRALNRQGWVYVTYQTTTENRKPYINELVAVKLDGSRVERITHLYNTHDSLKNKDGFVDVYNFEAQAVPSPDGFRVIWASDFNTYDYPVQDYVADFRDKAFSNNKFNLTTNNNGTGTGSLSIFPSAASYDDGSIVQITAVPDAGSEFAYWSGDYTGTENPLSIVMDGDKNITATFKTVVTVSASVVSSNDDAEEKQNGSVNTTSNDLELVNDGVGNDQTVGIRFTNLSLPQNAEILNAYIKFTATGNSYGASIKINGENTDSSLAFVNTLNNITNRDTTIASVNWNTTNWKDGEIWETPNLRSVVQEIVNRNGWKSGNALSIIISGSGKSRAYSFDNNGTPPEIVIKYALPNYTLTTNTSGAGNIQLSPSGGIYLEGETVTLTAVPESGYQFDGWSGDISGAQNPDSIIMNSDKNITATFSQITNGIINVSINSGSDDAEEYANGATKLSSPDLELVNDGSNNDQTVGMRFTGIDIPHGAIITSAYIEFNARDNTSSSTTLQLLGEDVDSSFTFSSTANNITNRKTTSAVVNWEPAAWSSGSFEQTPDLSGIIQEIINRSNWKTGNALSIIVSGTGKRRAWSYDGTGTAPKLHVEYSLGNNSFMAQVSTSTDDAEEYANGSTKLSSPDLELVNDGHNNDQTIGIRFRDVNVPKGVTILSAYLEFTARDNLSNNVSLTLKTEDVDNSLTFSSSSNNITNRITSNSSVNWLPNSWEDGELYQSPELKTIVQEIISRNGWSSGNALSFIINGTGKRRAWSYDGSGPAPKLYIIYKEGDVKLAFEINSSNNDAEEYANGTMRLTSSDLELVNNGSNNDQTVGMRFTNITIPKSSTILNAHLEFVAKDEEDGNVSLSIKAENVDNPTQFSSAAYNISSRTTTTSSVSWSPEPWYSGNVYQSNDIKTLVQDIINRNGWQSGNALSIIITGTGKRRAWSYDGDGKAPKLYITYSNGLQKSNDNHNKNLPEEYELANYPNPFNPSTNIVFSLPKTEHVKINVYDIIGRKVANLVNDVYEAGNHKFNWVAQDNNGYSLASGIYIVRIESGSFVKSIKLMLLR